MTIEKQVKEATHSLQALQDEVAKVIVGQDVLVRQLVVSLVAGGNVLLEGLPGLGKTLLVKTLAECLQLKFSRIQFTPDLMPADILGTNVVVEDPSGQRRFEFQKGPIFGNLILTDEINRATPKTQSALLEAMQEHSVTIADQTYSLDEPFFVLATQNPIDLEGTYPLPEAQLDRFFFKLLVPGSSAENLVEILKRTTGTAPTQVGTIMDGAKLLEIGRLAREIPIADEVLLYIAKIISATHPAENDALDMIRRYVRFGSSARGAQALALAAKATALMDGMNRVSIDHVKSSVFPALRHRILVNFEADAEGVTSDNIVSHLLESVTV